MTPLAIMSDLHLDTNHFGHLEIQTLLTILQNEGIQHLHIAGDLANDFEATAKPFLQTISQNLTVTYNLGNHDMLGMAPETIESLDGQLIDLGERQLVHVAGWYDYSFNTTKSVEDHARDKEFYWFDRKLDRPFSDQELTQQSLDKLENLLKQADKPTIVALHFVPHEDFIPDHPYFQNFNAFLGSQAYHELFKAYQVTDVVFGHLHHHHDRLIDGIRYQARPLGYKREWQLVRDFFDRYPYYQFEPAYELNKRYRRIKELPEFQSFYQKELAKELRRAMTIFN